MYLSQYTKPSSTCPATYKYIHDECPDFNDQDEISQGCPHLGVSKNLIEATFPYQNIHSCPLDDPSHSTMTSSTSYLSYSSFCVSLRDLTPFQRISSRIRISWRVFLPSPSVLNSSLR